jgi:hypothetical protein
MICEIEGTTVVPQTFSYRDIGFGDPVALPVQSCTLRYSVTEVCALLDDAYRTCVRDLKADFEATGDASPAYLHDLGYPAIDNLVQNTDHFCRMIHVFLLEDLLRQSFPWSDACQDVQWILNNVDAIASHDGVVEIFGHVFRKV